MKHLLIHAWALYRCRSAYYISYTHWIYLREMARYFDAITLLSPVKDMDAPPAGMPKVEDAVSQVRVIGVPWYSSYAAAMRLYFKFRDAYKKADGCTHVYVRYPVPFGWMCRDHFVPGKRIIHFVGDPVDTINSNVSVSRVGRVLKTSLFAPEFQRYIGACKLAHVFTNGPHLKKRLERYDVQATSLVSSTLLETDFYFPEQKFTDSQNPRMLFVGYLRRAKGLDTLLNAFAIIKDRFPGATLTIVGDGEMKGDVIARVEALQLQQSCTLTGHIEDRQHLNNLMRNHDVFLFTSISEGSPRSVLEAMANGLPVVSTRVGSLPDTFIHDVHLLFADIGDEKDLALQVIKLLVEPETAERMRKNAFDKVKQHTLQAFIQRIFGEV